MCFFSHKKRRKNTCVCVWVHCHAHALRRCQCDLFGLFVYGTEPFLPSDVRAQAMNRALCVDAHTPSSWFECWVHLISLSQTETKREREGDLILSIAENRFSISECGCRVKWSMFSCLLTFYNTSEFRGVIPFFLPLSACSWLYKEVEDRKSGEKRREEEKSRTKEG